MKNFSWKKLGLIFSPQKTQTPHWMQSFAQAPHVVQFDDYIRVYISSRPLPDEDGQYVSYSGFIELDDNFNLLKISENPILELGKLGTFDEFGTYPVTTIENAGKIQAFYAGWTRCESVPFNTAIGTAFSNDGGINFERIGDGPIISYSLHEPFVISGPKIRKFNNKFYLFYIAGSEWIMDEAKPEPIYKIRAAVSDDGLNFTKFDRDLVETKLEFEAQASPDVFYKDGRYHMFFCYRGGKNYRGKENGYRIGYASSVDLENWERNDDASDLSISDEGWDSEMVSYPHVFERKGNTYMFYLGNSVGKEGFGGAILKREKNEVD